VNVNYHSQLKLAVMYRLCYDRTPCALIETLPATYADKFIKTLSQEMQNHSIENINLQIAIETSTQNR